MRLAGLRRKSENLQPGTYLRSYAICRHLWRLVARAKSEARRGLSRLRAGFSHQANLLHTTVRTRIYAAVGVRAAARPEAVRPRARYRAGAAPARQRAADDRPDRRASWPRPVHRGRVLRRPRRGPGPPLQQQVPRALRALRRSDVVQARGAAVPLVLAWERHDPGARDPAQRKRPDIRAGRAVTVRSTIRLAVCSGFKRTLNRQARPERGASAARCRGSSPTGRPRRERLMGWDRSHTKAGRTEYFLTGGGSDPCAAARATRSPTGRPLARMALRARA